MELIPCSFVLAVKYFVSSLGKLTGRTQIFQNFSVRPHFRRKHELEAVLKAVSNLLKNSRRPDARYCSMSKSIQVSTDTSDIGIWLQMRLSYRFPALRKTLFHLQLMVAPYLSSSKNGHANGI